MAMGDSITAGFAMIGYPPVDLIEDRDYGVHFMPFYLLIL
jgi:hypothetical protein